MRSGEDEAGEEWGRAADELNLVRDGGPEHVEELVEVDGEEAGRVARALDEHESGGEAAGRILASAGPKGVERLGNLHGDDVVQARALAYLPQPPNRLRRHRQNVFLRARNADLVEEGE